MPEQRTIKTSLGRERLHSWLQSQPEISQAQLARDLGITPQGLSHVLMGRRQPSLEQAVELEDITGIQPKDWITPPGS